MVANSRHRDSRSSAMSSAEMEQLLQAKTLAMHNNPTEMLPKVLETTASMYHNGNLSKLRLPLAKFFTQLVLDVVSVDSPIANTERPFIAAQYLPVLLAMAQSTTDVLVYKNIVLIMCASYSLVLDLVAKTSNAETFDQLCALKAFVLSHWRTAYPLQTTTHDEGDVEPWLAQIDKNVGVKLATIKFMSEAVLAQTKSSNGNDINSASVPDNHPVLNRSALENEAKKLLDTLLNYLIEEQYMVSPVFIGIINTLSFIIKRRPQTTIRILSGLLRFNVDAKFPLEGKPDLNYRLSKRFVERAYKNFVQFGLKNQIITKSLSSGSGSGSSIYSKLTKISQTLHVIGEETKSKGILNFDPSKGNSKKSLSKQDKLKYISLWKRQLSTLQSTAAVERKASLPVPALTAVASTENMLDQLKILQKYTLNKASHQGNHFFNNSPKPITNTYSSVYSLMNSSNSNQDVTQLPNDTLIKLSTEAILQMDTTRLISGLSIVASRYTDLMNTYVNSVPSSSSSKRKPDDDEDDDDVNNGDDDGLADNSKKVKVEVEEPTEDPEDPEDDDRMQKMLQDETAQEDAGGATRPSSTAREIAPPFQPDSLTQDEKLNYLTRLTTKLFELSNRQDSTPASKSLPPSPILLDDDDSSSWLHVLIRLVTRGIAAQEASDLIREQLLAFFIQDFEQRVSLIIEWLNEEWFFQTSLRQEPANYNKWSLQVLESLGPFLENNHRRFFIRLMSELPSLHAGHLDALKPICLDPARSSLGFQTLKFLVMFRPPVQAIVRDLLLQLKQEDEGLHKQCDSLLDRLQ
ncbi:hypothetical protein SEUBUCD646_0A00330 [Saccharomyces eubayanus]|uniref:Symplekin/Pta1 N-terminal domain-containing protein n=1 Tax=Saccharomyces eubayanus TaxID=1080349 RepID=A0ABN8VMK7_SACEU|nr:hypothetical protein SEUBUCD650_0A00320 [Saccharomyces eubayanus]CAI1828115.1 hypothetical protein SEUBUCD646_0A00330 [Saccharomyces eubayanus]